MYKVFESLTEVFVIWHSWCIAFYHQLNLLKHILVLSVGEFPNCYIVYRTVWQSSLTSRPHPSFGVWPGGEAMWQS